MTENTPVPAAIVPAIPAAAVIYDRRRELRVKIKSLAAEARLIRGEEQRCRNSIDRTTKPEHQEQKIALEASFARLRQHRVGELRRESRYSLLAYALIRGMPWICVERSRAAVAATPGPNPPLPQLDKAKLCALVERFGWVSKEKAAAQVEAWLA